MPSLLLPPSGALAIPRPGGLPSSGAPADGFGPNLAFLPGALAPSHKFRPLVILFHGPRGQGKSLLQTATLKFTKQRAMRRGIPWSIATNYFVSFADISSPKLIDDLVNFPDWAQRMTVGIDEIVEFMPSGQSQSRYSWDASSWFRQIRKFQVEVVAATQFPQEIDRKLLRQINLFIECREWRDGKGVAAFITDYWGQWTGKTYRKPFPPTIGEHDWELAFYHTDSVFGDYNTEEYQVRAWAKNRDDLIGKQWDLSTPPVVEKPPPTVQEILSAGGTVLFDDAVDHLIPKDQRPRKGAERRAMLEQMGYRVFEDREVTWVGAR